MADYDRTDKSVYEQLDYLFDKVSKLENASGVDENTEPAGSANHPAEENPAGPSGNSATVSE